MGKISDVLNKIRFNRQLKDLMFKQFSKEQQAVILDGLNNKLQLQQIKLFAVTDLNHLQMKEVLAGIQNGLTRPQIETFNYGQDLTHLQMKEIRLAFQSNTTHANAKLLINPLLTHQQMAEIRIGLENGLNIAQTKYLLNQNELSPNQLKEVRIALEQEVPIKVIDFCIRDTDRRVRGTLEIKGMVGEYKKSEAQIASDSIEKFKQELANKHSLKNQQTNSNQFTQQVNQSNQFAKHLPAHPHYQGDIEPIEDNVIEFGR